LSFSIEASSAQKSKPEEIEAKSLKVQAGIVTMMMDKANMIHMANFILT
jgi:hypothetical protein